MIRLVALAAVAACAQVGFAEAVKPLSPVAEQGAKVAARSSDKMKDVLKQIATKTAEIDTLKTQAKSLQSNLEVLSKSTNEQDQDMLKKIMEQVESMNQRLERLSEDVEFLKGWVEGQNEALPIIAQGVADLQRFRPSMYMQFQYRDSDQTAANGAFQGEHAFAFRRIRFGAQYTVDPRTSIRFSADFSTGGGTDAAQLRDAQLRYDIEKKDEMVGTELYAGQQALPLGYELERSSAEREFPERATYNRRMFNGERNRSVFIRHGLDKNTQVFAGVGSSMTFLDPEQTGRASMPFGRAAFFGGVRYETPTMSLGASLLNGKRPRQAFGNVFSPEVDRRFFYVDATLLGLVENLVVRAEYMVGSDRVPLAATATGATVTNARATDMTGWQAQLLYNISERNQIFTRMALFDPNTDTANNAVKEFGVGYRYFINPGASLTFTYEWFEDPALGANEKYKVLTTRFQFRF